MANPPVPVNYTEVAYGGGLSIAGYTNVAVKNIEFKFGSDGPNLIG